LEKRKLSLSKTLHSNCGCGYSFSVCSAPDWNAGGILGGDLDTCRDAINPSGTVTLSVERIVATALGASLAAVESTYFGSNLVVFALAIFLLGILSFVLRLEKTGCRYASVTLTIIVLISRTGAPWMIATHRFLEVSIGIIVALVVVAIWQEQQRPANDPQC
jgi:hypothetical protein